MKQELFEKLDELEQKINSEDFFSEVNSLKEWGGADVVISNRLTSDIKKWLGDQPLVISLQKTEPRRRAVITEFSKELSWLFYQLRDIFAEEVDYISKYDFYGLLAQAAIDYLEVNQGNAKCNELLNAVIDKARSFVRNEVTR
ncbi:MAG: hypothetical protein MRK02_03585 [Candidatus Scalindua sp.]|nr:hypothetical protein [Candidatus Scalindua sp.]